MTVHPIQPVYDESSEILILGSFPSVRSREQGFFYAHPQNRFWNVTAAVFGEKIPETVEEKKAFLLRNHIKGLRKKGLIGHDDYSIAMM